MHTFTMADYLLDYFDESEIANALEKAVERKDFYVVKSILDTSLLKTNLIQDSLETAACEGNFKIVKYMAISDHCLDPEWAIHYAKENGHFEIASYLKNTLGEF